MATSLTALEQETIVNSNLKEKMASVYSADPNVIRKLDKLVAKYPDTYKIVKEDEVSKTYEFPKKLMSFRPPQTRVYTEEEKEALRAQLKRANEKRLEMEREG